MERAVNRKLVRDMSQELQRQGSLAKVVKQDLDEYEFSSYKMRNGLMPASFNPAVPDEFFAKTSKTGHFMQNMNAWREENKEKMKQLSATQQRMIYKYMLAK